MEYKVVMPVLSDTMDKGKLIKWYVNEGDYVNVGDKIAEVESDKATMDIETFKAGVVKKLLVSVGEEVPVKSVIAIIDTEAKEMENAELRMENKEKNENEKLKTENDKKMENELSKPITPNINSPLSTLNSQLPKGSATPAAKKLASEYDIDIEKLQKKDILPTPAHEKDIKEYKNNISKSAFCIDTKHNTATA